MTTETPALLRVRFLADGEDYRPVNWPVKHPYWCTGSTDTPGGERSVVVAYAASEDEIRANWPEAEELEVDTCASYTFTSRFPKPVWFENTAGIAEHYPDATYPPTAHPDT